MEILECGRRESVPVFALVESRPVAESEGWSVLIELQNALFF